MSTKRKADADAAVGSSSSAPKRYAVSSYYAEIIMYSSECHIVDGMLSMKLTQPQCEVLAREMQLLFNNQISTTMQGSCVLTAGERRFTLLKKKKLVLENYDAIFDCYDDITSLPTDSFAAGVVVELLLHGGRVYEAVSKIKINAPPIDDDVEVRHVPIIITDDSITPIPASATTQTISTSSSSQPAATTSQAIST